MLLQPNGRSAKIERQPLGKDEIQLVTTFENWLIKRGIKMDLLCLRCIDEGAPPRLWGDNSRNSAEYKMSCSHAERVYNVPLRDQAN